MSKDKLTTSEKGLWPISLVLEQLQIHRNMLYLCCGENSCRSCCVRIFSLSRARMDTSWLREFVSYVLQSPSKSRHIKVSPKECFPGLVNFVAVVTCHTCFNLPRALSQPGKHPLATPVMQSPCEVECTSQ